ncbi:beta-2 adrenergic receptor [Biomphalaria glabrata]|nr:beta-2 adrenergic receptor [Biomphalaria glabrata]
MNSNYTDHQHFSELTSVKIVLSFFAVFVSVMTLICNTLLIYVIVRSRVLQTPTNIFIASLAVGEILTGIFAIPFAAASVVAEAWPFSVTVCEVTASFRTMGRSSSSYSLMAVCLDRCVAVSRPLRYNHILTATTSCVILACIWLIGLTMAVLPLNYWGSYQFDGSYYLCILVNSQGSAQHLVKEIVCSFIPATFIVIFILQIIREVKSHHRIFSVVPLPVASVSAPAGNILQGVIPGARGFNRNTTRAMRSLFLVTFGYAVFCLPASVVNISYQDKGWPSTIPRKAVTCIVWMSFFCCVVNPIIIILLNRKFRAQLKIMFRPTPGKQLVTKKVFTISSGLHIVLDATLVLNLAKNEHSSTTASGRRQILGVVQAMQ